MPRKKERLVYSSRNHIDLASIVRHRVPVFGDAPEFGPDTRLQSVYLVEGTCNQESFGAVVLAPDNFDPKVDMYGPVSFEFHEKQSVGVTAMVARPDDVETIEHPEIGSPEEAAAFAEAMREHGRALYSGEKVLLDVPFRDKDAAKALGARWSPEEKRWYVMSKLVDMDDFAEWLPEAPDSAAPGM